MDFGLARDQVELLETAVNLWASRRKANDFLAVFSSFELGGLAKHLMTCPAGHSEFCFPSTSTTRVSGKRNSLFPLGPVIKCLVFVQLINFNWSVSLKSRKWWGWGAVGKIHGTLLKTSSISVSIYCISTWLLICHLMSGSATCSFLVQVGSTNIMCCFQTTIVCLPGFT